ncbi:MarR family winged helix-turn-helix transcriptional regulator [Actinoalloteichus hymeniacidonis]|uniref:Transcriptional regulator n=1 Tax=Actinoalloteichus hymeniacidonis TaxID=340345 RepID=A0AAC9HPU1_9PSEU|nr:hypothetical protein [Actinoalloteichus hymeniacidonis]AOS63402.1 hypothetical protein TL08_12940 [Actinoalloteichus hymeniacidonis]MBB5908557.1 hypothetical protein [Actinoalloteichus hymeniacidonis]
MPRIHPSIPTRPAPTEQVPVILRASPGANEPWLVWEALLAAAQRWTVRPAEALRHAHGISVYDYRLLRLLARAPHPMRKAIVTTALDLPPRSLDHSVTRLAERGFLLVRGARTDRRLVLTPAGTQFLIEVVATLRSVTDTAVGADTALRPSERAALVALLARLRT